MTEPQSATATDSQSKPAIVWFVGLTTLDIVHHAEHPDVNQKVTATRQDIAAGGPAANAAITAAALGVDVALITALGEGAMAGAASTDLELASVNLLDTAWLGLAGQERHDFAIPISSVVIDTEGHRSIVSADSALSIAPAPTMAQLDQLVGEMGWPDVVMFDGHHPEITEAVLDWIDDTSTAGRVPPVIVLDGGRWRPAFKRLLSVADVAALSADFQVPGHDDSVTGALASGARSVIVTHGPDPVEWHSGADHGKIEVPDVVAANTSGAGDVFHGALTAAIAIGDGIPEATRKAIAVASERVQYEGPRDWILYL